MSAPLLAVEELRAGYGRIEAVHGVSFEVAEGEAVTLIGANGAGKTTLLRAVAGLLPTSGGRVRIDGADATGFGAERCVAAGVSLVPEGRQVFPSLAVRDNLALGAYHRRRRRRAEIEGDLEAVYGLFPQLHERSTQLAGTLSGGEQQMLAIGRGLMSRPRVLLLDEPSLGLAPLAIREVIQRLQTQLERGTTVLLAEQNAKAALELASRGHVMAQGEVVLSGSSEQLRTDPQVRAAYLGGSSEAQTSEGGVSAPTGDAGRRPTSDRRASVPAEER
jgi:branched-chain amino acid transport system ATP-binding protein